MCDYMSFYKVIVLKIDLFESSIIDERHFSNNNSAIAYSKNMINAGYTTMIVHM